MTNNQDELSPMSYYNREKNQISNSYDTYDTCDKRDKYDNTTILNISRYEPPCIQKARDTPDLKALQLLLSWLRKRRGAKDNQPFAFTKAFLAMHNLNAFAEELLSALEGLPTFTCEYAENLGFCAGDSCSEKLPPAERLILDTEYSILFHSIGKLRVKVRGVKHDIELKKLYKKTKDGRMINTAILEDIFIEAYYVPPIPPISHEDAERVVFNWLETAEVVHDALDSEADIERLVLEILTSGEAEYYPLELLKQKKIKPRNSFFVDGDRILIESKLFREKLEELGLRDQNKVRKATLHLLAGPVKYIRYGNSNRERAYFWQFNIRAVQTVLRKEGVEWEPEIKEDFTSELSELLNAFEAEETAEPDGPENFAETDEIDLSGGEENE